MKLKIVAISDTHNQHQKVLVPECDLLIHAGDWTSMGHDQEVIKFTQWLGRQQQAKNIVVIPGNHELHFEKYLPFGRSFFKYHCPNVHLLIEESVEIEGIKIYGSPITPWFCDWAWNRHRGEHIQRHWDAIPNDTQILITHGPPLGILDQTCYPDGSLREDRLGCYQLAKRIEDLKDLDLHFFGHIHTPGGQQVHKDGVNYYNAAICDEMYKPTNPITVVEYET